MTAALLALALCAPAAAADYALPAPPPGRRVDYSAERVDYDADSGMIHLSTGVTVHESTWTVKGSDMRIDVNRRLVTSDAPLILEGKGGALYGDAGEFDLDDHTGTVFGAKAGYGEWRIHGPSAQLRSDGGAAFHDADFTSCDLPTPHYHFHSQKVTIVPHSALSAWNVLFYLGDIPLFYFPYFYHDLSPNHLLRWKLQPGDDARNGVFLHSTLDTPLGHGLSSKTYLDEYSKQGVGAGGELNYQDPHDKSSAGGIYAYNVDEFAGGGADRWGLAGSDFQALPSSTSFQTRLQMQSDPNFNNDYVRSSAYTIPQELVNSAALNHRFDHFAARVVYSRDDILNSTGAVLDQGGVRYIRNTESLPRVEFQTESLDVLGLPWLNMFNGYADNNYDLIRGYTQQSVAGQWEATRGFNLGRGITFTPRTDVSETEYNRFDDYMNAVSTISYADVALTRWTTSGDLRWNSHFGSIDARQTYTERMAPNGMGLDSSANDRGIEQNDFQLSDLWWITPDLWTRLSGGYTFQNYNDHTLSAKERFEPVQAEATWTPNANLVSAFRTDYQPAYGLQALIAYFSYGDGTGPTIGGNFEHNQFDPENYYESFNFAVSPTSSTWKVIADVGTVFESLGGPQRLHGLRIYEKDLAVIKTWHDFITKAIIGVRPGGVGEYSVLASLRLGSGVGRPPPQPNWESQFFPQGASPSIYRP